MDLQSKYIEQAKTGHTLVDIYTDRYGETNTGFIIDYNDEFVCIEEYNNDGLYDGISVFFREHITRIRWEGNELNTIAQLIGEKGPGHQPCIDLTSVSAVLTTCQQSFGHVSVHIQDIDSEVCFIGEIREMDDDHILLHEFGTIRSLDRQYILLSLHDITRIDANGLYEKSLVQVFQK